MAWFLVEDRGSSFRITQQTVTLGLLLLALGAVGAGDDFRTDGWTRRTSARWWWPWP